MAPGRLDYVFLHARILAEVGAFPEARSALAHMLLPAYPQNIRAAARSLMGYIVGLERFRTEQATRAAGRSSAARMEVVGERPSSAGGNGEPDPQEQHPAAAGAFRPDFRPVGAAEERVEGVLEAIDCAGGAAVFMVRGSDGVVRFPAPRLDAVDFITYRDDLKGSITCGPLKEAPRVYVTFTGATADTRRVVAIEFLPK